MKFTCSGDVRGGCGIIHLTYKKAKEHCEIDAKSFYRGGFRMRKMRGTEESESDRHVVPLDNEARIWMQRNEELL